VVTFLVILIQHFRLMAFDQASSHSSYRPASNKSFCSNKNIQPSRCARRFTSRTPAL